MQTYVRLLSVAFVRSNRSRSGLTLLEMVLALFLFAILVPLFAGIWPIHKRAVNQNQASLCGNHICRQVLEDSVSAGYDGVDSLETTALIDRTISLVTEKSENGVTQTRTTQFVWSVDVKTDADEPSLASGEKLVNARVDWEDGGQPKAYEMSTILVENP